MTAPSKSRAAPSLAITPMVGRVASAVPELRIQSRAEVPAAPEAMEAVAWVEPSQVWEFLPWENPRSSEIRSRVESEVPVGGAPIRQVREEPVVQAVSAELD